MSTLMAFFPWKFLKMRSPSMWAYVGLSEGQGLPTSFWKTFY